MFDYFKTEVLTEFSWLKDPLVMLQPKQITELIDRGENSLGEILLLVHSIDSHPTTLYRGTVLKNPKTHYIRK
jgi:hypothetical protein